ncbi:MULTISPECIES: hypothetical protein [Vibrio]|uniref:hypothetical protein n=1 Tax=Vibrio TaxID=662 RepID=UPI001A2541DA|nr:hypothetical protein [Vibrio cholerae]ELF5327081.1 hypothetical protein [Vibrio cholerae]MBJ6949163.1 hypothetical protein [Vibrio cholerae]MCD6678849.1 hypothetical protein [Vibrio cholerae]
MSSEENEISLFKKIAFFDVFPFICRLLGICFIVLAFWAIGFPPKSNISSAAITLLIFSVFFLCLPLAKKISIGKLLTFEKEVKEVKAEVKEFKAETREFLGVYSNMITAISNTVNNQVTVNLPSSADAEAAKDELKETKSTEDSVFNYINAADGDYNLALARIRMDIESNLREIHDALPIQFSLIPETNFINSRPLSLRQLFRKVVEQYPQFRNLSKSLDYVTRICNAAIHGHIVDENHGHEAIYLGLAIISELKELNTKNES